MAQLYVSISDWQPVWYMCSLNSPCYFVDVWKRPQVFLYRSKQKGGHQSDNAFWQIHNHLVSEEESLVRNNHCGCTLSALSGGVVLVSEHMLFLLSYHTFILGVVHSKLTFTSSDIFQQPVLWRWILSDAKIKCPVLIISVLLLCLS